MSTPVCVKLARRTHPTESTSIAADGSAHVALLNSDVTAISTDIIGVHGRILAHFLDFLLRPQATVYQATVVQQAEKVPSMGRLSVAGGGGTAGGGDDGGGS